MPGYFMRRLARDELLREQRMLGIRHRSSAHSPNTKLPGLMPAPLRVIKPLKTLQSGQSDLYRTRIRVTYVLTR